MAYYGVISLSGQSCVDKLRASFLEGPTTWVTLEGRTSPEYRFLKSPRERMTVMVNADGTSSIRVFAENFELTKNLEAQLLDMFSEQVLAQRFFSPNSPKYVLETLATHIDNGWFTHIHHFCINRPTEAAIGRLIECHKRAPLPKRGEHIYNRDGDMDIGGPEWGVIIGLQKADENEGPGGVFGKFGNARQNSNESHP